MGHGRKRAQTAPLQLWNHSQPTASQLGLSLHNTETPRTLQNLLCPTVRDLDQPRKEVSTDMVSYNAIVLVAGIGPF